MLINIKKILADNPSPSTHEGTNTYILGNENLVIIDPGPDSDKHLSKLINYIGKKKVELIVATHHHADHIGLLHKLSSIKNSPIFIGRGQINTFYKYDSRLEERCCLFESTILTREFRINTIHTPGHSSDHYCFHIPSIALFSGDHIMGWSTTMIRLPDGNMRDYLESLELIKNLSHEQILPAHGEKILDGKKRCQQLIAHRNKRSLQVKNTLKNAELNLSEITEIIYGKINKKLIDYAKYTLEALLENMIENNIIKKEKIKDIYYYSIK